MSSSFSTESVPTTWDDERDSAFFRITSYLYDPEFCFGASVLLASNDPDEGTSAAQPTVAGAADATPRFDRGALHHAR